MKTVPAILRYPQRADLNRGPTVGKVYRRKTLQDPNSDLGLGSLEQVNTEAISRLCGSYGFIGLTRRDFIVVLTRHFYLLEHLNTNIPGGGGDIPTNPGSMTFPPLP